MRPLRSAAVLGALPLGTLLLVSSCAPRSPTASAPLPTASAPRPVSSTRPASAKPAKATCVYRGRAPEHEPFVVGMSVHCEGAPVSAFEPDDPAIRPFVKQGKLTSPAPGVTELSYEVELDAMARAIDRFDTAQRFGASLVAAASSFLLIPQPKLVGVPVTVELDAPSGFATGLRRGPHGYALESHELPVATYTAFGAREVRSLEAAGIAFRLALLDGRLDLGPERVAHWLETSLAAVTRFYREPPDEQILVIVAPLPDRRGVRFGKLLPESAPGIVILVGEHTTPADLTEDWMLVHELFHVGTPSFDHEGDWLDEGLATYFEPLIRARAGFTDEKTVWREMASEMPRGLHALTEIGLLHGTTRNDLYWGGGLFCLLADVEARRRTGGERGLEDGLRAVLRAGGRSSEVWGLDTMVETLDLGIGSPVVHELYEKYAKRASPLDFTALLRDLGVVRKNDKVRFVDQAPLASVRRALLAPR